MSFKLARNNHDILTVPANGRGYFDDYADVTSVMGSTEMVPNKAVPTWRGLAAPQLRRLGECSAL